MPTSRDSIIRRVRNCADLPTLPEVVRLIVETVEDDSSSAEDLTRIIESDAVITTRLLRMANSPFYGGRFRVDTVRRAVVVVGFDTVKELALGTSVLSALQRSRQLVLDATDFWMHSFGAGKAAQLLATSSLQPAIAVQCFTAALLHDIGKYILALTLADEYRALNDFARLHGLTLWDVEQRQFDIDHAEIAAMLLKGWGLPQHIVDPVRHQYFPDRYHGPYPTQVAIVSACSEISRLSGFGHAGDTGPLRLPPFGQLDSGLTAEAISQALSQLPGTRGDAKDLVSLFQDGTLT